MMIRKGQGDGYGRSGMNCTCICSLFLWDLGLGTRFQRDQDAVDGSLVILESMDAWIVAVAICHMHRYLHREHLSRTCANIYWRRARLEVKQ